MSDEDFIAHWIARVVAAKLEGKKFITADPKDRQRIYKMADSMIIADKKSPTINVHVLSECLTKISSRIGQVEQ